MACGFSAEDLRCVAWAIRSRAGPTIAYIEESEPLGTAGPIRLAADRGLARRPLPRPQRRRPHRPRPDRPPARPRRARGPRLAGPLQRRGPDRLRPRPHRRGRRRRRSSSRSPTPDQIDTDMVNAGAYVLEREVARLIPPGRAVSIEREVFPRLVGQGLYGLPLSGYWMDIGTPERYLQASWDILEGVGRDRGLGSPRRRRLRLSRGAAWTSARRSAAPALIDAGATVAAHAIVGPRAVIGRECRVGEEAAVSGSVLLAGSRGRSRAPAVTGSILAQSALSSVPGASVGEGSVIGADVTDRRRASRLRRVPGSIPVRWRRERALRSDQGRRQGRPAGRRPGPAAST